MLLDSGVEHGDGAQPAKIAASPVEVSWGSNKKKKACKIPSKCNQSAATAEAASSALAACRK